MKSVTSDKQFVDFLGLDFHADQEFGVAQQIRGDVQRSARHGKTDAMTRLLDRVTASLQALDDEGEQAVAAAVRLGEIMYVLIAVEHFSRAGKGIFIPDALCPEGRGLGAHAVFGPEPGQEHDSLELPHRFQIGLQPQAVVVEIIHYRNAGPAGQPGAVDNQPAGTGSSKSPSITFSKSSHCGSVMEHNDNR